MKFTAAVAALTVAGLFVAVPAAQAAGPQPITVTTPLAISTHGQPNVLVGANYRAAPGIRALNSYLTVFDIHGKKILAGRTVHLAPGQYTTMTAVRFQHSVTSHPSILVTVPGTYESLYEDATCTVTSWSSVDSGLNYDDQTPYLEGQSTANCVSAQFPGVVESDFGFWGYNYHLDTIPTPAPAGFIGTPGAVYSSRLLFSGYGPATTVLEPTTVVTWTVPVTQTVRRPITVVQ